MTTKVVHSTARMINITVKVRLEGNKVRKKTKSLVWDLVLISDQGNCRRDWS